MKELLETLRQIGLPVHEVERISAYYQNDIDGLRDYVRFMRAMLDDRHEYV